VKTQGQEKIEGWKKEYFKLCTRVKDTAGKITYNVKHDFIIAH
jgi:hypothetical protein